MSSFTVRRLALATTALALTGAPYAPANAALCTWSGGAGDWSNAAKWSCGGVPGSGDSIHIDGQGNLTSAVSVTNTQYIGNVTIDSGDSLTIANATLGLYNSAFVNNGAVVIGSGSTLVGLSGSTVFSGSGAITLNDIGSGAYLYTSNGTQMTFGVGQTISGAGYIGRDQGVTINNGIINANAAGAYALNLDAQGGSGGIGAGNGVGANGSSSFLNTGLLEATNGGTLNFISGLYENQGAGSILASGAGSTVVLGNDVRILGGTITGSNGGAINALSGTQYLDSVTLGGGTTFTIANDVVRFDNTLTNGGTIAIGASAQLVGESPVLTIAGGNVTLAGNNSFLYNTNGTKMTLTSGTVVSGAGYVGQDQGVIVNNGTITANLNGQTLNLDAQGGSGGIGANNGVGTNGNSAFLNTGVLEATGGATLNFISGLYENQGNGALLANGTGSSILLSNDVRILGGTITGSGGGAVNALSGTQYLQGVTLGSGTPFAISSDVVRISATAANGGLVNNGTITISNGGILVGESATTALAGTGSIILAASNAGSAYLYNYNGTQMTIGSGQSIRGLGYIGQDQGVLVNNGTITATAGAGGLTLDAQGGSGGIGTGNGVGTNTNSAFLNNNLIQATGGGTLYLNSGLYENAAGGQILAVGNGSQIILNNDVRILGGTITGSGGGAVNALSGTQYLQGVTLGSGTPFAISSDVVRISATAANGGLVNNGTITISNGGILVGESATTALAGTGSIILAASNAGSAYLYNYNGTQMTIGSGQSIRGLGYIGQDQGVLVNNGTITATAGAGGLTLDAQGGSGGIGTGNGVGTNTNSAFLNNNLIQATGGGTLYLNNGLYENAAGGQILAVGNGSQIVLNNDVRILGGTLGGAVSATSGNQYLQNVTLANGTDLAISGDVVRIDNTVTNNGTITVGAGAVLFGETTTSTISGNGAIVLTDPSSAFYDGNGTQMTIGAGQFVHGTGSIGLDQGLITNAGNILADGAITIDAQGGSSGLGGGGLGTGGNAGFYNAAGGQVQANNGGATLTLAGGLYEQAVGASFSVGTGSNFVMGNDSNLANLQAGGVLNKGLYFAFAGGTMSLRSNQTGAITTIGTNTAGTDTSVTLSGAGSVISVMPSGGGTVTSLDQSLNTIAASGALSLSDGRAFTASNGAFSNAGLLQLNSGASFTAPAGLANSGAISGNGTIGTPITNSGSVIADGGTLFSKAITGATGTIQSNAGGTLDLSGAASPSSAGFLTNNGALALGNNSITVTSDYTNANFGSGNAFNAHANVTGSGLILAASATQDLSGPGLNGSLLNVGNVRLGGSSSTTLTITNNGTLTTLRGAVESPVSNSVSISSNNFVVGPNGGSTTVTLSYTGTVAGSLAGNTITVANNFDNVVNQTLSIVGAAYNPAEASLLPTTIDLGATRVGGTLAGSVTIANTAPVGAYSEKLAVTGAVGAGGASGTAPVGLLNPGASATSAVSLGTATSGSYSGTVTYGLATDGTGTSGLARAALASQSVTVSGRVYQAANAQLSTTSVDFGTVRQGSAAPTATVAVTNTANGALTDHLNTSIGSLPQGVTGTAPGALAGGASGNASFSQSTAIAGQYNGQGTLNFTSTNAELTPLALASQNIAFTGTVTELAVAQLAKGSGAGIFAGAGQSFTLDLGSIAAGAGSLTTGFDIFNANSGKSYSELLNGMFNLSGGTGYSFSGGVSGLAGGNTDANNWLTFNYSGLAAGNYNDTLTFLGYSHYAGLADYALTPITVNIHATIMGGGGGMPGGVPEPTTWTMLILGFGAVASALRRRRRADARVSL